MHDDECKMTKTMTKMLNIGFLELHNTVNILDSKNQ